jgi:hypothetical protein
MSREDLCGIAFFTASFISFLFASVIFIFTNYNHLSNFDDGPNLKKE